MLPGDEDGPRLRLGGAFEALFESFRVLARPSSALFAGLLFPVFSFALTSPEHDSLSGLVLTLHRTLAAVQPADGAGMLESGGALNLSVGRMVTVALWLYLSGVASVGLARALARPRPDGRLPRFGELWRAGKPLARPAWGLLLARLALPAVVLWIAQAPAVAVRESNQVPNSVGAVVLALPVVVALLYALLVEVVAQLALQSLVANERGVVSALEHAWRLVRAAPWDAARATLPYLALLVTTAAVLPAVRNSIGSGLVAWLVEVGAWSVVGIVSAGHWGRVYGLLGGMRTVRAAPAATDADATAAASA